jgi:hypothetical protein
MPVIYEEPTGYATPNGKLHLRPELITRQNRKNDKTRCGSNNRASNIRLSNRSGHALWPTWPQNFTQNHVTECICDATTKHILAVTLVKSCWSAAAIEHQEQAPRSKVGIFTFSELQIFRSRPYRLVLLASNGSFCCMFHALSDEKDPATTPTQETVKICIFQRILLNLILENFSFSYIPI